MGGCAVLALALLAPTALGRMLGEVWLTAMRTVIGLISALFGSA